MIPAHVAVQAAGRAGTRIADSLGSCSPPSGPASLSGGAHSSATIALIRLLDSAFACRA
jgi:hypothetical protein